MQMEFPERLDTILVGTKRPRIACGLERRTRDRKDASSNPGRIGGRISFPQSTLCADSYSVSVPHPVLRKRYVLDPGHSAKSAGGRLHLNMHTTLTQRSQSGADHAAVQE